jgi:hypothetical protein
MLLVEHETFFESAVDSNLAAAAGIAEMLLKGHSAEIDLLPALPSDSGNVSVQARSQVIASPPASGVK